MTSLKKAAALGGWGVCVLVLVGWLVLAVHRGRVVGVLITSAGLVLLVVIPVLAARSNRPPS